MGKAFRTALPRTSPVCISFFLLALSYSVLMGTRGFSFLWPMCMSAFIFTGSMEFVAVNLLVSAFNPFVTFMLAVMLGTMLTRFLPFLLFPESKEPPRFITYLGTVLPYAMTGLLVVYSLKGVRLTSGSHGIPELLAIIAIALLHIWKRNMLLSIAGGTAVYMLLVQLVFS